MANWTRRRDSEGHAARIGGHRRAAAARFLPRRQWRGARRGRADPDPLRHLVLGLRHQCRALDPGQDRHGLRPEGRACYRSDPTRTRSRCCPASTASWAAGRTCRTGRASWPPSPAPRRRAAAWAAAAPTIRRSTPSSPTRSARTAASARSRSPAPAIRASATACAPAPPSTRARSIRSICTSASSGRVQGSQRGRVQAGSGDHAAPERAEFGQG